MVKVAVAGGTGGLGLHVVEGIVEAGNHEVVVLSRKSTHPVLEALGVPVIAVSYDDPVALTRALEGVHTVISTIAGTTEDTLIKPQLALLDAAVTAGVKRFAPSEFSARSRPDHPVESLRVKWPVVEAVKKSGLEYTIYENSIFMNYFATGTAGVGHVYPARFTVDVESCTATLPGDGSAYIVYTRLEDIGKFVAASLDLEKWPELSQMRGDRIRLSEILRLAEEVRDAFYLSYPIVVRADSCNRPQVRCDLPVRGTAPPDNCRAQRAPYSAPRAVWGNRCGEVFCAVAAGGTEEQFVRIRGEESERALSSGSPYDYSGVPAEVVGKPVIISSITGMS